MKKQIANTHSQEDEILVIDEPYLRFESSISEIEKMRSIGNDIVDFSIVSLKNLVSESEKQKCFGMSRKIQNTISALENIEKSNSDLNKKLTIISNQSLILLISNFERFLSDFSIILIENYSYLINWPDKKFSIDLGTFQYGSPTLGELVLKSLRDKYSFQDLKSIINFADEFLEVKIGIKNDAKDKIILYHAMRHVLIHNLGVIDDQFLKQVRNIDFFELSSVWYSKGDKIEITEENYIEARDLFVKLAKDIYVKVRNNMAPF